LKFHPNDKSNLREEFKKNILSGAHFYLEFFDEHHLDPGYEPASYSFGKNMYMDVRRYEEQEETLALLKILALCSHEIEQGKFRDVEEIFAELDKTDH
jgi:hypothetical protein